ncbi:hypothetical protein [Aeromonas caviae]|uniref:Uncharacterized protein n=1 Tax=Aeromonas caviae TaxID=648 RepID=A0AAV4YEJ1_AERCA|nr:hypothetical protein [Aeromonas caviae]GJA39637.1 hypothetical protein KAM343_04330 [Aeromonas caviae]GJA44445.1 hypothetical protein KAM346_07340 [Aeromonas caviae]
MSTHDIRIDFTDANGKDCTTVLVKAVPQAEAIEMLSKRWEENSLVASMYDLICDELSQADIYICRTTAPMSDCDE